MYATVKCTVFFYRAMLCIARTILTQRMSVRLFATRRCSIKTTKHILTVSSPSGSHTILVFLHAKRCGSIPTGTPLTGASNAGYDKIAICDQYLALSRKWYKIEP